MARNCCIIVTLGLLLGIASDRNLVLSGFDSKEPITIRAEELGKSVRVLGKLGFSLRSVVSVSGVWVELTEGPSKPGSSLWLRVIEVNGKQFDKPVEFRQIDVEVSMKDGKTIYPTKGEQWEMRAYETWPEYGHPTDFFMELGQPLVAPPPRGPTRLIGILKERNAK